MKFCGNHEVIQIQRKEGYEKSKQKKLHNEIKLNYRIANAIELEDTVKANKQQNITNNDYKKKQTN